MTGNPQREQTVQQLVGRPGAAKTVRCRRHVRCGGRCGVHGVHGGRGRSGGRRHRRRFRRGAVRRGGGRCLAGRRNPPTCRQTPPRPAARQRDGAGPCAGRDQQCAGRAQRADRDDRGRDAATCAGGAAALAAAGHAPAGVALPATGLHPAAGGRSPAPAHPQTALATAGTGPRRGRAAGLRGQRVELRARSLGASQDPQRADAAHPAYPAAATADRPGQFTLPRQGRPPSQGQPTTTARRHGTRVARCRRR